MSTKVRTLSKPLNANGKVASKDKSAAAKKAPAKVVAVEKKEVPTAKQFQEQLIVAGTVAILKPGVEDMVRQVGGDVTKLDLDGVVKKLATGPEVLKVDFKQYKAAVRLTADMRNERAMKGLGCRRILKGNGVKYKNSPCGADVIVGFSKMIGKNAIFCSKCIQTKHFKEDESVHQAVAKSKLTWYEATGGMISNEEMEDEDEDEDESEVDEEEDNSE